MVAQNQMAPAAAAQYTAVPFSVSQQQSIEEQLQQASSMASPVQTVSPAAFSPAGVTVAGADVVTQQFKVETTSQQPQQLSGLVNNNSTSILQDQQSANNVSSLCGVRSRQWRSRTRQWRLLATLRPWYVSFAKKWRCFHASYSFNRQINSWYLNHFACTSVYIIVAGCVSMIAVDQHFRAIFLPDVSKQVCETLGKSDFLWRCRKWLWGEIAY